MNTLFISYDGALDPLGASQVIPYLVGLARRGVQPTLVSFEKPHRLANVEQRQALAHRLTSAGVRWRPLRYHKRPRMPATLWDVAHGAVVVREEAFRSGAVVVHCRGDVAMWMARLARLGPNARLLYDVRGFFADERVESGSWRRGGALDRGVRRVESGNLARADGIVVLTRAGLVALSRRRAILPPHRVIPTCVDLTAFRPRADGVPPDFGLIYVGALGSWYMVNEMVQFAKIAAEVIPGRVLFLTPDADAAMRAGAGSPWAEVKSALPAEVPGWLQHARASFFFIRPTPAKQASSPTKLGEALATGLPVVANSGIGDVDSLLDDRAGVLVSSFSPDAYRQAALRLRTLLLDPTTAGHCRRLAEEHLDLETALQSYRDLYAALAATNK